MHSINLLAQSIACGAILMISGLVMADENHEMEMPHMAIHANDHKAEDFENVALPDHSIHPADSQIKMRDSKFIHQPQEQYMTPNSDHQLHAHHQEHGGQIYQATTFENKWVLDENGHGELKSKLDTWIGSDENKLFIKGHLSKFESISKNYDLAALYSRNIADFWDLQLGAQYSYNQNRKMDQNTVKAMLGLHGMAPYFFETDAYVYIGKDQDVSLSLETERDLLLTQKLIAQPYLDIEIVLSDDSNYAQKKGLSNVQFGVRTRYEITKKLMPFIDVAYHYDRGNQQTVWQKRSTSESGGLYGAGILLKF